MHSYIQTVFADPVLALAMHVVDILKSLTVTGLIILCQFAGVLVAEMEWYRFPVNRDELSDQLWFHNLILHIK